MSNVKVINTVSRSSRKGMYGRVADPEVITPPSTREFDSDLANLLGFLSLKCEFSLALSVNFRRERSVIMGASVRDCSMTRPKDEWRTLQIGARSCRQCKQGT